MDCSVDLIVIRYSVAYGQFIPRSTGIKRRRVGFAMACAPCRLRRSSCAGRQARKMSYEHLTSRSALIRCVAAYHECYSTVRPCSVRPGARNAVGVGLHPWHRTPTDCRCGPSAGCEHRGGIVHGSLGVSARLSVSGNVEAPTIQWVVPSSPGWSIRNPFPFRGVFWAMGRSLINKATSAVSRSHSAHDGLRFRCCLMS